jgi:hypothetical protein
MAIARESMRSAKASNQNPYPHGSDESKQFVSGFITAFDALLKTQKAG